MTKTSQAVSDKDSPIEKRQKRIADQ